MFLAELRIKNYRAIRSATLSCENGITVLIGENGCGKSSVLNALEACLGRKLRGDEFDIKSSDFFNDLTDNVQATHLEIELKFTDRGNEKADIDEDDEEPPKNCASSHKNIDYSELRDEQGNYAFTLKLVGERYGDRVDCNYSFHNLSGQEVLAQNKCKALLELRRLCPFMRIRSSVLRPPVMDDTADQQENISEDERSQRQVEKIIMQAYGDLLREADYNAEQSLYKQREKVNEFYVQLDNLLKNSNNDVKERVVAPLSPLSKSWMHYVSLLRGSGARSVAMLYFAGAFFNARGREQFSEEARPILSIEYPEANLHPLMLTSLWNLIDRFPVQMLVTTYCVELLSAIDFSSLRRIVRSSDGIINVYKVDIAKVNRDDMRRIAYHLRVRRGTALFMRVWLLVEGETEYWLLPEIARAMGFDLWQEGVEFIEFAQCGLEPLVRLANQLGISWFLLCDGDKAGQSYSEKAEKISKNSNGLGHVIRLSSVDIEHSFWDNGYAEVFVEAAGIGKETIPQSIQHQQALLAKKKNLAKVRTKALEKSREVIKKAIKRTSKPGMALLLGKAVTESGLGIPNDIENLIFNVVRVAREVGDGKHGLLEGLKPDLPDFNGTEDASMIDTDYTVVESPLEITSDPLEEWGFEDKDRAEDSSFERLEGECERDPSDEI